MRRHAVIRGVTGLLLVASGTGMVITMAPAASAATGSTSFVGSYSRLSADRRYAAFVSYNPTLVSGDTNDAQDVFVRNLETGATTRVSVDSAGRQADNNSMTPSISADGKYVAFTSWAKLTTDPAYRGENVYLHSMETGETKLISAGSFGAASNDGSVTPVVSADGSSVVFESAATNLVSGDTSPGQINQLFTWNRETARIRQVSVDAFGRAGNENSGGQSVSTDGRYIAFITASSNLDLGGRDTNNTSDVYVRDTVMSETHRVSLMADRQQSNDGSRAATISADGRFVAFSSTANLVPGDTNTHGGNTDPDVYLCNWQDWSLTWVSVGYDNEDLGGAEELHAPQVSADGRYVAFESVSSHIVPNDGNSKWDVFVRDLNTATTTRASVASDGSESNDHSQLMSLASDGHSLTFWSWANNLVPGAASGLYVRNLGN